MAGRELRALGLLAVAAAATFGTVSAEAQDKFPSRPVTLIVPFAAGGRVDIHFRALAKQLEQIWNVPVPIDVKPGAAGTLGPATMAASAKPDGYTLSELPAGVLTVPLIQNAAFDPMKDFTWIMQLTGYRYAHIVPKARWANWDAFVADAKANPGKIKYASAGTGGPTHIGTEIIAQAVGIKLLHLPTKGTAEAITSMMGGHVDFLPTGPHTPMIQSGEGHAILSWTDERQKVIPDAPTLAEVGIKTELSMAFPYGIGGPKGMAPDLVKQLNRDIRKASETPEMIALLDRIEQDYLPLDHEEYTAFAKKQYEAYRVALGHLGMLKK